MLVETPSQKKPEFLRSGSVETFNEKQKAVTEFKKLAHKKGVPFKIPIRAQSDSPRDPIETARSMSAEQGVNPRRKLPLQAVNSSVFMLQKHSESSAAKTFYASKLNKERENDRKLAGYQS